MARCEICGKALRDEVFQVWWLTSRLCQECHQEAVDAYHQLRGGRQINKVAV